MPALRDHVLVGLFREDGERRWVGARDVAARTGLSSGTVGQALIRLRDDALVQGRERAAAKREWKLTERGVQQAVALLPRVRGRQDPEAQGLAWDGSLTLVLPGRTIRLQMMDPRAHGFRRHDKFGLRGPRERRPRRPARRRRGQRRLDRRRRQVARAQLNAALGRLERAAQLQEVEQTMQQMVADGELVYDATSDTYQMAEPVTVPSAPAAAPGSGLLLETVSRLASSRGWASTRDIAAELGVDGRSIARQLIGMAESGLLEQWKPGQGTTLYRLTGRGLARLRR